IGVWGSSAGGQLVSLLGLAGPDAGFDTGQYADRSSRVDAVVDMFGPSDLLQFGDSSGFARFLLWAGLGTSPDVRRRLSPIGYVHRGAPPFLIVQGRQDSDVLSTQSTTFARRLRAAGVPATLVLVSGTGHSMATPGQQPTPEQVTDRVLEFFRRTLAA
ncbi:MAG: prolyl oligopeptidase family serine peptidase, partial [Microlunatus sp.]|nr:prolyl oligopeptidase family serine peptidase [Microlunatus sp.]